MLRQIFLSLCIVPGVVSTGLYANKKPKAAPTSTIVQMPADQKILHALNRLTFGPRPGDTAAVRQQGLERWIDAQLHPESISENPLLEEKLAPLDTLRMSTAEMLQKYPGRQMMKAMMEGRLALPEDATSRAAVRLAMARAERKKATAAASSAGQEVTVPMELGSLQSLPPEQLAAALETLPPGARRKLAASAPPELRRRMESLEAPMQVVSRDLAEGKLLRAIYSNRQLQEVLTDFWYNHFNVYLDKGADRSFVTSYERDVIRPHVLGKFKDLLLATAQSPAMLFYLDNWQSAGPTADGRPNQKRRQGLNENYGRELMELHTLGVDGGYSQGDVTEVARCFTGWTIRQPQRGGGFEFNARLHDRGEKHVLGVTIAAGGGIEDGLKVLDLLAHHPSTARFISRSLAIRFVSDNPPEPLIARMAGTFISTDGDLREVMKVMLASREFNDPAVFRDKLKSPLEMVVSAVRVLQADVESAASLTALIKRLGEPLYSKQEPTGYSNRGTDWLNSASLLGRMNFALALTEEKVPGVKVDSARFAGDPRQIERGLLFLDPSAESVAVIEGSLRERRDTTPAQTGALVAALTLGSPDFQRK